MTEAKNPSGRIQLLLIAAVFFGPLIVAAWLYFAGEAFQPEGRANHGALLEPIDNLAELLPETSGDDRSDATWLLVFPVDGACDQACRDGLYTTRQLRLMLGREMDRVTRVFLRPETVADTVSGDTSEEGLLVLDDTALAERLANARPATRADGGYFLVDPQGNLVMYFDPGLAPRDIVSDIKRLLRLSHIG